MRVRRLVSGRARWRLLAIKPMRAGKYLISSGDGDRENGLEVELHKAAWLVGENTDRVRLLLFES